MIYEHFADLPGLLLQKLITKRKHPTEDLWIYNYSPAAQSLKIAEWSPALRDCRGLVLTEAGEIVGRPFGKFWNYEQVLDQIPTHLPYTISEKMDGSLGILFMWNGCLHVATRGSFESEQAQWALRWLHDQPNLPDWFPEPGTTLLVEIIYPENRIVVDYGKRQGLFLLAVMNADGTEDKPTSHKHKHLPTAHQYNNTWKIEDALKVNSSNEEGFVVRWENGFRAKIKFEEYKRLHRLITQVSTRSIWELLRAGKDTQELMDRVPEDFKAWVLNQITEFRRKHRDFSEWTIAQYRRRPCDCHGRKTFAEWAKLQDYPSLLFAKHDNKPLGDMIWRMLEPKWSTPFKRGIDE